MRLLLFLAPVAVSSILLLAAGANGLSASQQTKSQPASAEAPVRVPATNALVYTGTIGRSAVVLTLQRADSTQRITARYYYLRWGSDLALAGWRTADTLDLDETTEPHAPNDYAESQAHLRLHLSGDSLIQGYWQATDKPQRLLVKLRRRPQAYDYAYAARLSPGEQAPHARILSVAYTNDAPNAEDGTTDHSDPMYTLVTYPLVTGLPDRRTEAALNDWLTPELGDGTWPRTRLVPGKSYDWWNGCYLHTTSIARLTPDLVSVVYRDQTQGCSSPPYQVNERHTTRRLADLRPYRLDALLQGNYRALFRRCIREQVPTQITTDVAETGGRADDPDNHCRSTDVVRLLQAQLDTTRTTDGMLVGAEGLSICYYDFSTFCYWPVVGAGEIIVPYDALRPYIRPNSALARALPPAPRKP